MSYAKARLLADPSAHCKHGRPPARAIDSTQLLQESLLEDEICSFLAFFCLFDLLSLLAAAFAFFFWGLRSDEDSCRVPRPVAPPPATLPAPFAAPVALRP